MLEIENPSTQSDDQEALQLHEVIEVAKKAREEFESNKVDDALLGALYHDYNPNVEDVNLFIQRSKQLFPNLNCGLASVYLKNKIKTGIIINGKYGEEDHTFLVVNNVSLEGEVVVDITSDQYGGPQVYVGLLKRPWALKLDK